VRWTVTRHLETALNGFRKDAHSSSAGENAVPAEPISKIQRERVAELVARRGLTDFVTDRLQPFDHQAGGQKTVSAMPKSHRAGSACVTPKSTCHFFSSRISLI
jgi:hypothetical protein